VFRLRGPLSQLSTHAPFRSKPTDGLELFTIKPSLQNGVDDGAAAPSKGITTGLTSSPKVAANSASRWSWAGTAMMAPQP